MTASALRWAFVLAIVTVVGAHFVFD